MGFDEYMKGLEKISIKVTPLRRDISGPPPYVLVPDNPSSELRDSTLPRDLKRVIYDGVREEFV